MLRIEARSKLTPEQTIAKAVEFFGGYGLTVRGRSDNEALFEGGGGGVDVLARAQADETIVEVVSREWDYQAREFARSL